LSQGSTVSEEERLTSPGNLGSDKRLAVQLRKRGGAFESFF